MQHHTVANVHVTTTKVTITNLGHLQKIYRQTDAVLFQQQTRAHSAGLTTRLHVFGVVHETQ